MLKELYKENVCTLAPTPSAIYCHILVYNGAGKGPGPMGEEVAVMEKGKEEVAGWPSES